METLQEYQAGVFSAHAEVVPPPTASPISMGSILRARGGSSSDYVPDWVQYEYSPRTRR